MSIENENKTQVSEEVKKQEEVLVPSEELVIKNKQGKEFRALIKLPLRKKLQLNRIVGLVMQKGNISDNPSLLNTSAFVASFMGEETIDIVNLVFGIPKEIVESDFEEEEILNAIVPFCLDLALKNSLAVAKSLTTKRH